MGRSLWRRCSDAAAQGLPAGLAQRHSPNSWSSDPSSGRRMLRGTGSGGWQPPPPRGPPVEFSFGQGTYTAPQARQQGHYQERPLLGVRAAATEEQLKEEIASRLRSHNLPVGLLRKPDVPTYFMSRASTHSRSICAPYDRCQISMMSHPARPPPPCSRSGVGCCSDWMEAIT